MITYALTGVAAIYHYLITLLLKPPYASFILYIRFLKNTIILKRFFKNFIRCRILYSAATRMG